MKTMTDEVRLMSPPPPAKKLARQRQTAFLMAAALVAVVAIVCCIAFSTPTQHRNSALTHQEYAFARDLMRHEIRQQGAVLTSATVTVGYGRVTDSNLGYSCTSGRLLLIKLIGDFPHTVTTGHPVVTGAPTPDFTIHAVVLIADAETGRACLLSVQTGNVAPEPGAVSLSVG